MKQKILVIHNRYLIRGGEDEVFDTEVALLKEKGHRVDTYIEDNKRISELGFVRTGINTIWSWYSYKKIREIIRDKKPDIIHVHNIFPLISPSVFYAAAVEKVPVVQTLHNFRLLCLNAFLFRNGKVCNDCVGKMFPFPGIRYACYRQSRAGSTVVAAMLVFHRMIGTWRRMISQFIVLTGYARQKFILGGIPGDKITIKGYFLWPDPGIGSGRGDYFIYIGRLSEEKGIRLLLDAWQKFDGKVPLKIIGEGPLNGYVSEKIISMPGVEWLGRLPLDQIVPYLKEAKSLIVPSLWYEGMPRVILESYAVGTPVIASDLGAMWQMIKPGFTGLHFDSGQADDLVKQVEWLMQNPSELAEMRLAARAEYETKYSAETNYHMLVDIYNEAMEKQFDGKKKSE